MTIIASFFLGAKHWQLFLLSLALLAVEIVAVSSDATLIGNAVATRVVFSALYRLFLLGWMWAAGTFLNSLLEDTPLERDVMPFYVSLVVPFVLVLVEDFFVAPKDTPGPWVFALWVATFAFLFFAIGFVADVLRRVETGKPSDSRGMVKYCFAIWFFAIGIWWLQPKINRLYNANVDSAPREMGE